MATIIETTGAETTATETIAALRAEYRTLRANAGQRRAEWEQAVRDLVEVMTGGAAPTPEDWVRAARLAVLDCGRCGGTGIKSGGACFACGGEGFFDAEDLADQARRRAFAIARKNSGDRG